MLLFYHAGYKNFGDVMNPWFWQQLLPGLDRAGGDDIVFSGIGSILNDRLPKGRLNVVFGSGAGYGSTPGPRAWKFYAVRGPNTAKAFGLSSVAFGDPALLTPFIAPCASNEKRTTIFIPHRESGALGGWRGPCDVVGIKYVDPQSDFLDVIRSISNSELVITESLHGAIIADAYRVPWIPVVFFHSNPFKWNDFAASLNLTYRPNVIDQQTVQQFRSPGLRLAWKIHQNLAHTAARRGRAAGAARRGASLVVKAIQAGYLDRPPVFDRRVNDLRRMLAQGERCLSPEGRLEELQEGLLNQLARFREDWGIEPRAMSRI